MTAWTYTQLEGLFLLNGVFKGAGYAGAPGFKNNPAAQNLKNLGPLPRGRYTIEAPVNTKTHGPYVLWLTPDPANEMFGRSDFGIHGDSVVNPGAASEGCIVTSRLTREKIWGSGVHVLDVVPFLTKEIA